MRGGEDRAENGQQRGGAGLLDSRLEEVGGLKEDRGADAGEKAGKEMEGYMRFELRGSYILLW